MATPIYSERFYQGSLAAGQSIVAITVPTGFVYIVRWTSVYAAEGTTPSVRFWLDPFNVLAIHWNPTSSSQYFTLDSRLVMHAGESLRIVATATAPHVTINGYKFVV